MAIRDLKVYAQSFGSEILHYRDSAGLECDAVLHTKAGEYALIEVKLSQAQEDAAAKTLKKLRDKITRAGKKEPSCLIVLIATGFAHKRQLPIT